MSFDGFYRPLVSILTRACSSQAQRDPRGARTRPERTPVLVSPLRPTCGVLFCGSRTHASKAVSRMSLSRDGLTLVGRRPARNSAPSERSPVPLGARLREATLV